MYIRFLHLLLCLAPIKLLSQVFPSQNPATTATRTKTENQTNENTKKIEQRTTKSFLNVSFSWKCFFRPRRKLWDFRYKNKTWDPLENSLLLTTDQETVQKNNKKQEKNGIKNFRVLCLRCVMCRGPSRIPCGLLCETCHELQKWKKFLTVKFCVLNLGSPSLFIQLWSSRSFNGRYQAPKWDPWRRCRQGTILLSRTWWQHQNCRLHCWWCSRIPSRRLKICTNCSRSRSSSSRCPNRYPQANCSQTNFGSSTNSLQISSNW